MEHSEPTLDTTPFEALSSQLELLTLNTAIEAITDTEWSTERAQRLAALKQLLREVQTTLSWCQVGATNVDATKVGAAEDEALGSVLSDLAQRLNQAVAGFDR